MYIKLDTWPVQVLMISSCQATLVLLQRQMQGTCMVGCQESLLVHSPVQREV